ncbi:MAG: 1-deoxy-D-xylulose-5-phosphate synthase [Clostridia bacterium]|nr:1-deoxy-D-xylulose-5-phosphate synthase [Clostridia bacterium]
MEQFDQWPVLGTIASPADLKELPAEKLETLAKEIREYLVFRVGENGGHLASNLGVVELTLAIHRVFDSPVDHIVFDVGHQSYVHKLLTGRKEDFDTLRAPGGLSGFTKRTESAHDPFGAGHSSTAISAAIGLAEAEYRKGSNAWTVAVVGDGALTGGLAYEALNNCPRHLRLILIINENEMSISPNTGRLANHLARMRTSGSYLKTKEVTSGALRHIPLIGRPLYYLIRRAKRGVRHLLYKENLFEHMGIRYRGPVDGHDTDGLIALLDNTKRLGESVLLHVKTKKGMGYAPAASDPNAYHSLPPKGKTPVGETFSGAFGRHLCRLAEGNRDLCAITAAMSCGTGLEPFRAQYPDRFWDVGIAEGHAVTFASGLCAGGLRPVVAVYSTFLQRAYDNVLHDAALQELPLVLCIDRAGLNAGDGPTHHGIFDVALLSALPGVTIYAPVTLAGLGHSLEEALTKKKGVSAIRYPNGGQNAETVAAFYPHGTDDGQPLGVRVWENGVADVPLTVVTHGRIATVALEAARALGKVGIGVRIVLCEILAPYDRLAHMVAPHLCQNVLFLEEEIRTGGFGMCLCDALERQGTMAHRHRVILGTENGFVTPEKGKSMLQAARLDAENVQTVAEKMIKGEMSC